MVSKKAWFATAAISLILFLALTLTGVSFEKKQLAWCEQQNITDPILREMAVAATESGIDSASELSAFIQEFGLKKDLVTRVIALSAEETGGPLVVGFEVKADKYPKRWKQMIASWNNGKLQFQEIQPAHFPDSESHYPFPSKAIAQKQGGNMEIGLIYDLGYGSAGTSYPVFELWRRSRDASWSCIWSSPQATCWRNVDGSIEFPEGNLNTILLKGTGYLSQYAQDNIFFESHAGPHRVFQNTWVREGDEYVLTKWDEVQVTPYSVLTDFIYAISIDNNELANSVSMRPELLQNARDLGLAQRPLGSQWHLEPVDRDAYYGQPTKERYIFTFQTSSDIGVPRDFKRMSFFGVPVTGKPRITVEISKNGDNWNISNISQN